MSLLPHPTGNYLFLPGIAPYSCGAVSAEGHEIIQVTFQSPPPLEKGFSELQQFLKDRKRPISALCGISLRSPKPYTFEGFSQFNSGYAQTLKDWGIFADDMNPVARTNVAPVVDPPNSPVLYGFSFTSPTKPGLPATFVIAGAGELPEGVLKRDSIFSLGNTTPEGLRSKSDFVMNLMERRLFGLGQTWPKVTVANIYTRHEIRSVMEHQVLSRMTGSSIHGAHWHYSAPPIEEIEFEMDMRGTRTEIRL